MEGGVLTVGRLSAMHAGCCIQFLTSPDGFGKVEIKAVLVQAEPPQNGERTLKLRRVFCRGYRSQNGWPDKPQPGGLVPVPLNCPVELVNNEG